MLDAAVSEHVLKASPLLVEVPSGALLSEAEGCGVPTAIDRGELITWLRSIDQPHIRLHTVVDAVVGITTGVDHFDHGSGR